MNELFAFLDLSDMQSNLFWAIRAVAAFVGAVIGWFVSVPVWRGLYRLAFRRAVPGGLMPLLRLGGAGLFAVLVFFFLPLGGGGGFGWGSGGGGGFGLGPGPGAGKNDPATNDGKNVKTPGSKKAREKLEIEIIGGARFKDDGKYFLIGRKDPAMDREQVENFLKEKKDSWEVIVVLTGNSVADNVGVRRELHKLLDDHGIPHRDLDEAKD